MTRWDKVIIVAGILFAVIVWTGFYGIPRKSQQSYAVLTVDGKELARLPLSGKTLQKKTIQIPKGPVTIEYGQGKARILPHNYCPDGICWKTGWISIPGQSAVCVPNHMVLTIVGTNDGVDSIVQ